MVTPTRNSRDACSATSPLVFATVFRFAVALIVLTGAIAHADEEGKPIAIYGEAAIIKTLPPGWSLSWNENGKFQQNLGCLKKDDTVRDAIRAPEKSNSSGGILFYEIQEFASGTKPAPPRKILSPAIDVLKPERRLLSRCERQIGGSRWHNFCRSHAGQASCRRPRLLTLAGGIGSSAR
jgi:hypothetical protein